MVYVCMYYYYYYYYIWLEFILSTNCPCKVSVIRLVMAQALSLPFHCITVCVCGLCGRGTLLRQPIPQTNQTNVKKDVGREL